MITPRYAYWEGVPVAYADWEAWAFDGDHWAAINPIDVFHKASMVAPELFRRIFPHLPLLPPAAFQSEPHYTFGSGPHGQAVIVDAREAWLRDGKQWLSGSAPMMTTNSCFHAVGRPCFASSRLGHRIFQYQIRTFTGAHLKAGSAFV